MSPRCAKAAITPVVIVVFPTSLDGADISITGVVVDVVVEFDACVSFIVGCDSVSISEYHVRCTIFVCYVLFFVTVSCFELLLNSFLSFSQCNECFVLLYFFIKMNECGMWNVECAGLEV